MVSTHLINGVAYSVVPNDEGNSETRSLKQQTFHFWLWRKFRGDISTYICKSRHEKSSRYPTINRRLFSVILVAESFILHQLHNLRKKADDTNLITNRGHPFHSYWYISYGLSYNLYHLQLRIKHVWNHSQIRVWYNVPQLCLGYYRKEYWNYMNRQSRLIQVY